MYKLVNKPVVWDDVFEKKNHNKNILLNFFYLKSIDTVASAIKPRNKFIKHKSSLKSKLISLLQNKGNNLVLYKKLNYTFLSFLRYFLGLRIEKKYINSYKLHNYNLNDFEKLFFTYEFFKDLQRLLPWKLRQDLPMVKAVCIKKNQKKKKKTKTKKYLVVYKYIPVTLRLQTVLRWLSSLIKVSGVKVDLAFASTFSDLMFNTSNSRLLKLKKQIYKGLLNNR